MCIRDRYRGGSYLPEPYQREITARVRLAARRHGLHRAAPGQARDLPPAPAAPVAEQLTLL